VRAHEVGGVASEQRAEGISLYAESPKTVYPQAIMECADNGAFMLYPGLQAARPPASHRIIWHFEHGLHCSRRFSAGTSPILWFTSSDDYTFNLDRCESRPSTRTSGTTKDQGRDALGAIRWARTRATVMGHPETQEQPTSRRPHTPASSGRAGESGWCCR